MFTQLSIKSLNIIFKQNTSPLFSNPSATNSRVNSRQGDDNLNFEDVENVQPFWNKLRCKYFAVCTKLETHEKRYRPDRAEALVRIRLSGPTVQQLAML